MNDFYKLAETCGADIDGGECADYQAGCPGSPPTITFTDRQFEKFVAAVLEKKYLTVAADIERPLSALELRGI